MVKKLGRVCVDGHCFVGTEDDVDAGIGVEESGDSVCHPHSIALSDYHE